MDEIIELIKVLKLLSPNQAVFLKLLAIEQPYGYQISSSELIDLVNKKLIIQFDGKYVLRGKAITVLKNNVDSKSKFEDVFEAFPRRTPSGRLLRPPTLTSVQGKKLIKKFKAANVNAQEVLDSLMIELDSRRKTNGLEYMRNMETWINRAEWENYDSDEADEQDEFIDYG